VLPVAFNLKWCGPALDVVQTMAKNGQKWPKRTKAYKSDFLPQVGLSNSGQVHESLVLRKHELTRIRVELCFKAVPGF
jgi:hypothetical protein